MALHLSKVCPLIREKTKKMRRITNDEGESPSPSPLPEGEGIKDLNHSGWLVGSWGITMEMFPHNSYGLFAFS